MGNTTPTPSARVKALIEYAFSKSTGVYSDEEAWTEMEHFVPGVRSLAAEVEAMEKRPAPTDAVANLGSPDAHVLEDAVTAADGLESSLIVAEEALRVARLRAERLRQLRADVVAERDALKKQIAATGFTRDPE